MRQIPTLTSPLAGKAFAWLDKIADPLQEKVHAVFGKNDTTKTAKDWLNGTPLRHRLHPGVVIVPLGSWTAAAALDALDTLTAPDSDTFRTSADVCVLLGIASSLPSAATGLADWTDTYDHPRRVGMAHAMLNSTALALYLVSLGQRWTGNRTAGRTTALVAYGSVLLSGMLGGDMVYNLGVNVSHQIFPRPPVDYVDVMASSELLEGVPTQVEVERVPVILLRQGGVVYAAQGWCTHAGGNLIEGEFSGCEVTCPLHGARFSLKDGRPIHGPASAPLHMFDVREQNGRIALYPSYEGKDWPPAPLPPQPAPVRAGEEL